MMHKPLSELNTFEWIALAACAASILMSSYVLDKDDLKAIWLMLAAILVVLVLK